MDGDAAGFVDAEADAVRAAFAASEAAVLTGDELAASEAWQALPASVAFQSVDALAIF